MARLSRFGMTQSDVPLSDKELCRLYRSFEEIDSNRDGLIDREEMAAAMRKSGDEPYRMEVELAFLGMDTDKSGSISKEEFVRYMSAESGLDAQLSVIVEKFHELDADDDGEITLEEFQRMIIELGGVDDQPLVSEHFDGLEGHELIANMFRQMDDEARGRIDVNELLILFTVILKLSTRTGSLPALLAERRRRSTQE